MSDKAYLTYYGTHGIVPVRQDTADLMLHLSRRRSLYRHLGIHPLTLRNRRILEFGPGTGDNALYIASCAPELCVLVDGNPASIQAISDKFERGLLARECFECHMSDIREYTDARRFDLVLCEGVIPGQDTPETFLARVASFAADVGIVVITTLSAPSVLAEVCRRVIKTVFETRIGGRENLVNKLTHFFEPDLSSLTGMSRRPEDWVLDNILHPWPARITFTISEAIDSLDADFDLLGTSPCFIQDWRWYKAIPGNKQTWNDLARKEYDRWALFLLDYRVHPSDPIPSITRELDAACEAALKVHHQIWHHNAVNEIPRFTDGLRDIHNMIARVLPGTAVAIIDFLRGLDQLLDGNLDADFASFRTWFGRGQQYVSFTRK